MSYIYKPELPLAGNQRAEVNVVGGDHSITLIAVRHLVPTGLHGALEGIVSHGKIIEGRSFVLALRSAISATKLNDIGRFYHDVTTIRGECGNVFSHPDRPADRPSNVC